MTRLTKKWLERFARQHGIRFQQGRRAREFEIFRESDHGDIHVTESVQESYEEVLTMIADDDRKRELKNTPLPELDIFFTVPPKRLH